MEMATRKRVQPPWTPERRETHRAGCREAAFWRKVDKYRDLIEKLLANPQEMAEIKKHYGIE